MIAAATTTTITATETTFDENVVLPHAQLWRASKLARAFGHEWATVIPGDDIDYRDWTIAAIRDLVAQSHEDDAWEWGIPAPTVLPHGVITHTTGTGRSSWAIGTDGQVALTVERPGGWVLGAVIPASEAPDQEIRLQISDARDAVFYERHVDALFEMLAAVVPPALAARVCAPLYMQTGARVHTLHESADVQARDTHAPRASVVAGPRGRRISVAASAVTLAEIVVQARMSLDDEHGYWYASPDMVALCQRAQEYLDAHRVEEITDPDGVFRPSEYLFAEQDYDAQTRVSRALCPLPGGRLYRLAAWEWEPRRQEEIYLIAPAGGFEARPVLVIKRQVWHSAARTYTSRPRAYNFPAAPLAALLADAASAQAEASA